MARTTMSTKGQIVIPAEIRQRLGIGPGSILDLVEEVGGLRIRVHRAVRASRLDDGFGMLKYRGPARRLMEFDVAQALRDAPGER